MKYNYSIANAQAVWYTGEEAELLQMNCSAMILAGGASRRMGRDKAWIEIQGKPLVLHVVDRLRELTDDIVIVTNDPAPYASLGYTLVADEAPQGGPLAGLAAGLAAARNDAVIAVAVDMPFLNTDLLRYLVSLAADADVVLPSFPIDAPASTTEGVQGGGRKGKGERGKDLDQHPLHAVYRRACLAPIRAALARGERRLNSFYADVRVRVVSVEEIARYDPDGRSFWNINTPEDLARVR